MISIKINEQFLQIPENTTFTMNEESPLFLGGDMDKIVTGYSSNIKFPLTRYNMGVLGFPSAIDNYGQIVHEVECIVYNNGWPIAYGIANISKISNTTGTLKLIVNPYKKMKGTQLSELELEEVTLADSAAMRSRAKDTAIHPLDYNYAFFPVYNPGWWVEVPEVANPLSENFYAQRHQNFYNDFGHFSETHKSKAAMPFVRLDYLLSKIVENSDYVIENNFQITDELRSIYIYNNNSIYILNDATGEIEWSNTFVLQDHLPPTTASEFIKWVAKTFALALLPSQERGIFKIDPFQNILDSKEELDWTPYVIEDYGIDQDNKTPQILGYELSPSDGLSESNNYRPFVNYTTVDKTADVDGAPEGLVYVKSTSTYWKKDSTGKKFHHQQFNRIKFDKEPAFLAKLEPLHSIRRYTLPLSGYSFIKWPTVGIRIAGNMRDEDQGAECGMRIMIYRGLHNHEGTDYPYASDANYDPDENPIAGAELSLRWDGEKGLYEKYWKNWLFFLQNRKVVNRTFILPLKDIENFSWEKKVRVGNMLYFVNKLKKRYLSTLDNKVKVEAELSTIIVT